MPTPDPLSHFASELHIAQVPPAVRTQLGWILLDTVGAIVGGSAEPELQALAARYTAAGAATLPGLGRGIDADAAALINGTAGTFLEMDEGNRFSRGHPAVHVIPAALALSEQRGASADVFLSGVLAGYEVGSRIGAASRLRASMHPHGTWGTVGAAAACARVAGLAPAAMHETLQIASSLTTATSKQTMLDGGLVRNVYAGLSNRNGLLALQLAECGFSGERDGLASVFGRVVSEHFDVAALLRGLGIEWHVLQNYFKLHSCCRFNHGTLDALDQIAQAAPLPPADRIDHVRVDSYQYAAELAGQAPHNTVAAKFSVPFAVATRIVHGHSALSSFSWEAVRNPAVQALARRVTVQEDPAMTERLPQERPARVAIHLTDGRVLVGEVGVNRGDDALPYSHDELRAKFLDLAGRVWAPAQAQATLDATLALAEGACALADWVRLLRQPPA